MSDLKHCPFCGGEVSLVPEGDYHEIVCDDCQVAMWWRVSGTRGPPMNADLKPCPFCGAEVEIVIKSDHHEIVCAACQAAMWRCSASELEESWNIRSRSYIEVPVYSEEPNEDGTYDLIAYRRCYV